MLLDVGENHVELLRPLGPDTPVGGFLAGRGPGLHHVAYQVRDIEAALERACAGGLRLIDADAADRHPRLAGGLRAPEGDRRRADRDRRARRGDSLTWQSASASASRPARPWPARLRRGAQKLRDALGGEGWHDVAGEDGSIRLNLQHVLWLRVERDEHRVGFGDVAATVRTAPPTSTRTLARAPC